MVRSFRAGVCLPIVLLIPLGLLVLSGCDDGQQTTSVPPPGSVSPPPPPPSGPRSVPAQPTAGNATAGSQPVAAQPTGLNSGQPGVRPGTPPNQYGNRMTGPGGQTPPGPDSDPQRLGPGIQLPPPFDPPPNWKPVGGLNVGDIALEVAGEDLDGESFRLSEYRGKVVVLDFWGDW